MDKNNISTFEKRKKIILKDIEINIKLNKKDKSKQGFIDEEIKNLVNTINKTDNFYTTSSCAGRILVLFKPNTKVKSDVIWIFKSHKKSSFEEINDSINKFNETNLKKGIMFFKQEPMIIHLEAKDIDSAYEFLKICEKSKFKKKGIIGIKKRIIIEVKSSQIIEFPIGENSEKKFDDENLKWIINIANNNIKYNKEMIEKLEENIIETQLFDKSE